MTTTTAWMHPLARAVRVLADRAAALEKTLPADPHDTVGWEDYMRTVELLARVTESNKVTGLPAPRPQSSASAARAR